MKITAIYKDRSYQLIGGLIAADLLVFSLINPYKANALWLIIGYGLLAMTIVLSLRAGGQLLSGLLGHPLKASARVVRYAAVVLVSLIGLQSVGQLTPRDVTTLFVLTAVAYWYFGYGSKQKDKP